LGWAGIGSGLWRDRARSKPVLSFLALFLLSLTLSSPTNTYSYSGFPSYNWWRDIYPNETFNLTHTDMRNHLDPALDLNGATGEGMSAAELLRQELQLKGMMQEEDIGEVFREEWEEDPLDVVIALAEDDEADGAE